MLTLRPRLRVLGRGPSPAETSSNLRWGSSGNSPASRDASANMPKAFTETERQEFLAGQHIAVLSVAADDGRPPASVPIWYGYTPGGNILVNTSASRRKAKLIERAGAVTLVVQREELPYQYVIVEGTVIASTTPAPLADREAIAIRYLGEQGAREFASRMDGEASVLFTIRPDRWLSADYSGDM